MKCLNEKCKYKKLATYDCICPECGADNYYLWVQKIIKERESKMYSKIYENSNRSCRMIGDVYV